MTQHPSLSAELIALSQRVAADIATGPYELRRLAIEKLVFAIQRGDTPETNPVSALLLQWIYSARPDLVKDGE